MCLIVAQQASSNQIQFTPYCFSNSHSLYSKPILYPLEESTVTFGIEQWVEKWNNEKYLNSTTFLGKSFDWITGWTLNEEGQPNPSLFGRIKNLFCKNQENEQKKEIDAQNFVPKGNILVSISKKPTLAHGTYKINYWQENCPSPSSIEAKWELSTHVTPPHYFTELPFNKKFQNSFINTVLNDYFQNISEFCNNSTVCGCPGELKLFSYLFEEKDISLKIFNSDTIISELLLDNKQYPLLNMDLMDVCYKNVCNETSQIIYHYNVKRNSAILIFSFMVGMTFLIFKINKN